MLVASGIGAVDVVLLMGGKSIWNLANTVASLTLNLVLNLLLIPRLGITGAAIAWSVSILVNNLAPLTHVWAFLWLHPFGSAVARAALSAVALLRGARGLRPVHPRRVHPDPDPLRRCRWAALSRAPHPLRVPLQLTAFGQALRRRPPSTYRRAGPHQAGGIDDTQAARLASRPMASRSPRGQHRAQWPPPSTH